MDRLYRDKDWLNKQYWQEGLSIREIAKLALVASMTIHSWMCKHGIPRRTHAEATQKAWAKGEYEQLSQKLKAAWKAGRFSGHAEAISRAHARGVYPLSDSQKRKIADGVRRAWQAGEFDCIKGSGHYNWAGGPATIQCETCGKTFQAKVGAARRFCSKTCNGVRLSNSLIGENNPSWLGGISFLPYPPTFNERFKQLIRERDDYTCAVCKLPGKCAHHVNYIKADTIPENCITLCRSCHAATNINRDYWQPALVQIMQARSSFKEA